MSVREDAVPLSEEELRLLEQMERALAAEDPKFVSALQGRNIERAARLRVVGAVVVFVAGLGLLLGGAMAQLPWVSVIGFVVMLGSATLGLAAWRGRHVPRERSAGEEMFDQRDTGHPFRLIEGGRRHGHLPHRNRPSAAGPRRPGSFMQRVEQRWQRRRDQRGF